MKKVSSLILALCCAIVVSAQTPNAKTEKEAVITPSAVKKAFEKKFPKATKVIWGMEDATEYEAEFMFNGNELSANFKADGSWVETEKEIKSSEFPKAVSNAIKKSYPHYTIKEAVKTESAKLGKFYEAELVNGKDKIGVAYKEDGTPVKE